ncbi:MAG: hypothetical protein ACXWKG_17300, partial [Limisphaerales bacterium]
FTVTGSGEDIEDTADAFQFVHQPLAGDGQIVAHVLSITGPDALAEVGLMFRESLDSGSKHAFVRVNTQGHIGFRRRLAPDAYAVESISAQTNRTWLRLMRMANTFVAFTSTNGTDWEYIWFTTLNMSNQVEVGVGVTAHHNGFYATATVSNLSIGPLTPLSGAWTASGPRFLLGGEPWTETEFARVGGLRMLIRGTIGDHYAIKTTGVVTTPFAAESPYNTVTNVLGIVDILDTRTRTSTPQFYRAAIVP